MYLKGSKMSPEGCKASQMESIRLEINGHMTSVGEQILCVLEKHSSSDVCLVRVFVLERLREAAQFMYSLFQREMETLHNAQLHVAGGEIDEEKKTEKEMKNKSKGKKSDFLSDGHQERSSSLVQEEPPPSQIKERPEEADGSTLTLLEEKSVHDDGSRETEPVAGTSGENLNTQADVEDCGTSHPTTDVLASTEKVPDEEQEGSTRRVQQKPRPPQIKERPEMADATTLTTLTLELKSEPDDENREMGPAVSTAGETQADVEDCGTSQPEVADTTLISLEVKSEPVDENGEMEPVAGILTEHTETEACITGWVPSQPTHYGQLLSSRCFNSDTGEKSEGDDENREMAPVPSADAVLDVEDCGITQLSRFVCSESDITEDRDEWEETQKTTSRTGKKTFSCKDCSKMFNLKIDLQRHAIIHTGEKSFICTVCGRGFNRTHQLKRHKMTHAQEKLFNCTLCGKGFIRKDHLKRHICANGSALKSFCTVCGQSFSQSGILNAHMRIHTGKKPFKCMVCDEGFSRTYDLQRHTRTHTGEKPFTCSVCGEGFSRSDKSKIHMRTCKPFPVPSVKKALASKSS